MNTLANIVTQLKQVAQMSPPQKMIGPSRSGSRKCLRCRQPFQEGEALDVVNLATSSRF